MSAFNDGRCTKCNKRMGWTGEVTDKPACPACGHAPTAKEMASLEADKKEMEAFERLLIERKKE